MNKSRARSLSSIIAAAIVVMSFTFVYAQGPVLEGSYEAVLTFPKAAPTAILTFCPGDGDVPFIGTWYEDKGEKFVNVMTKQKINGNELSFTIQAGPGIWEFVCTIDGKTMKGNVTGDGATSPFEGPRIELDKDLCAAPE
jgi:hypothetical protein